MASVHRQGPPGTGKTLTTAVLATCFAAENMSSGAEMGDTNSGEKMWGFYLVITMFSGNLSQK